MNHRELLDLITRIKEEPSVLFLGQNYLGSFSGQNDLYDMINQEFCGGKMPSDSNYANLWEHLNEEKPLQDSDFAKIRAAEQKLPTLRWLRNILFMRWGMIMTSAVDTCLFTCTGPNIDIQRIPLKNKQFRREYMSKAMLHCSCLYNSVDGYSELYPPVACDPRTLRGLKKQASDRVSWIYDNILSDYGVLVIDGWDPNIDWAGYLLDNAGDMPYGSIYLFGATDEMAKDDTISGLMEDGILILEKLSFAQVLNEYGFFEEEDDYESFDASGKTITIKSKGGRFTYINIPDTALDSLDSQITLFHDELGNNMRNDVDRGELFAQFLKQTSQPTWSLHSAQAGFYFPRRIDSELREAVNKQLKKSGTYQRSMIILEGVSNSGKSATLIHLAMELRDQHICPVIFINGKPSQSAYLDNLKRFIKAHLLNRQDADGVWVENVVVIWDGNTASGVISEYERLYNELSECNVLLVASSFKHIHSEPRRRLREGSVIYCPVSAVLESDEINNMEQLLKGIDDDLWQRFQQAKERFEEPNLLTLLQYISNYRYSAEWKAVTEALKDRFEYEVSESQKNLDAATKEFVKTNPISEKIVLEAIRERGVGAAWQLQLENYLTQLREQQGSDTDDVEDSAVCVDPEVERLRNVQAHLQIVNRAIALAGQFSLPLPLSLLLRLMRSNNCGVVSEEDMFIRKCLANDSLVEYYSNEQGYYWVRFRHPSEAILYVEKNFGKGDDGASIQEEEIQLLCSIISSCRWSSDEAVDVITLVRCFGPNSSGKYNESIVNGHYERYMDNLLTIANTLHEEAYEDNEAAHVYAHFLREKYIYDKRVTGLADAKLLECGKHTLRDALERHDRPDSAQFGRLQGELCANLVASMPESQEEGPFDKDLFRTFQKEFETARNIYIPHRYEMRGASFSSNALLDIWLNAIVKFHKSFSEDVRALKDAQFVCSISDSIAYIDDLLDIDDQFSSDKILGNVEMVYSLASSDKIKVIGDELSKKNNDTYLYLNARKCWLTGLPYPNRKNEDTGLQLYKHNLFLVPDDADQYFESSMTLQELREAAVSAAKKVIPILEKERDLIDCAESSRCLYMLIRAKWLLYTGRFPLEEKQRPSLSPSHWKELSVLCDEYHRYSIRNNVQPKVAPLMINAVYEWVFGGDIRKSLSLFESLRQQWRGKNWFVERIGLCLPETTQMMTFHVDILRTASHKYRATICKVSSGTQKLLNRYNIYVSTAVLDYLFDNQPPRERYHINKPVVIWFNAEGPVLGLPVRGEGAN